MEIQSMARMLNGECRTVSAERAAMRSSPVEPSSTLRLSMRSLAFIVLLPLVLIGCEEKKQAAVADIDAGKAFAQAQCVSCHGLDGSGVAPGIPDLAAQEERYLLASLTAYKEGTRTHAA
ncbi:MAG: c-type cytochrome, partial [Alphaproteobacteria bacterium]|nr:c-type cytochrome [Alphaproteobacteria bacterium]